MKPKSWADYHILQERLNFMPLCTQLPGSLIKCPTLHSMDTANDRRLYHVHRPLGAEKRPVLSRCQILLQYNEG